MLAGETVSRSKLEDSLYESMRMLSMTEIGFPMPVRELHPFWCCEHDKSQHGFAIDGDGHPMTNVSVCRGCLRPYLDEQIEWDDARERSFHAYSKPRKWRCDFAWPDLHLIVEVEGGVYTQGRHTRPSGFVKDIEKYNALTEAGWKVLRFSRREVKSGEALNVIERVLRCTGRMEKE